MLDKLLATQTNTLFYLMRGVVGVLFALHGAMKLFGILGATVAVTGSQMWIGGVIELVAGGLMAVGLLAPYAAFLASGTMAVAYIQFHWQFQLDENLFPMKNNGELALVYAFVFLYIAARSARISAGEK